jgi:hypothetical protein
LYTKIPRLLSTTVLSATVAHLGTSILRLAGMRPGLRIRRPRVVVNPRQARELPAAVTYVGQQLRGPTARCEDAYPSQPDEIGLTTACPAGTILGQPASATRPLRWHGSRSSFRETHDKPVYFNTAFALLLNRTRCTERTSVEYLVAKHRAREALRPVPVDAGRDKGNGAGHVADSPATSRHRPQESLAGGFFLDNFIGT